MNIDEVRGLSHDELIKELEDLQRGMMNLRFRKATLQLQDSSEIKSTRRTIARIRTVLREREIAEERGGFVASRSRHGDSNRQVGLINE